MGKGRGGATKVIKKSLDQDGVSDMFNQLLGDEKSLDINIIKDKYNKLTTNLERIYKLLDSFKKTIYLKVLADTPNIDTYIKNINGFIEDCKSIIPETIEDDKLVKYYLSIKENKVIKDCIHMCKNLIIYKKYIEDNENLNDDFIKSSKTKDLEIFTFCSFDIKFIYTFTKIDESIRKYILIFLNMIYITTYEIYQIITSPDIDIEKFSSVIIDSIGQAKKMIPRANKAFKKIEESIELLQSNFDSYYRDFISTRNPSIILENFILDCGKDAVNESNVDLELTRQFKKIAMFYKRKSAGKIKDERINQVFELLDKNFKLLDVEMKSSDEELSEDEEVDTNNDILEEKN